MAKAGFWLRGARGKLAGASISKGSNGTIMREIVTPRNPRTTAQLMQRLVFSTATRTAKALREIIDHSFEGVEYGQKSVNYFTRLTVSILKQSMIAPKMVGITPYVPALPLGDIIGPSDPMVVDGLIISKGSLQGLGLTRMEPFYDDDPDIVSNMALTGDHEGTPNLTVTFADLSTFGFEVGKQYTFVLVGAAANFEQGSMQFRSAFPVLIARINFKSDAESTEKIFVAGPDSNTFVLNPSVLNLEESTNWNKIIFLPKNISETSTPEYEGYKVGVIDGDVKAGAVIVSQLVDGNWQRSTEKLLCQVSSAQSELQVTSGIGWNNLTDLLNAIAGEGSYASDWYLNQRPNA